MFQRGLFALRKMKKSRMRTYSCQCDSPDASRSENHCNHPCPSRPFSSFTLLLSPLPDRIFEDTRNEETRRHLVLYIDEASRVRCSGKLGDGSVSNASFSRIFFSLKKGSGTVQQLVYYMHEKFICIYPNSRSVLVSINRCELMLVIL